MRKVSKTSPPSTQLSLGDGWTSSQGASLANPSASPASEKEQTTVVISGRKCLESFAKFGQDGSWQRTFLELLIGTGGWSSSRCTLTWKLRGTRYKRLYCQLAVSGRHTGATGFGLLPTPTAETFRDTLQRYTRRKANKQGPKPTLSLAVKLEMLAAQGMLPTPTARDWKGPQARAYRGQASDLGGVIRFDHGITGHLSPLFVAEMMLYPWDWTLQPFLDGESKA